MTERLLTKEEQDIVASAVASAKGLRREMKQAWKNQFEFELVSGNSVGEAAVASMLTSYVAFGAYGEALLEVFKKDAPDNEQNDSIYRVLEEAKAVASHVFQQDMMHSYRRKND